MVFYDTSIESVLSSSTATLCILHALLTLVQVFKPADAITDSILSPIGMPLILEAIRRIATATSSATCHSTAAKVAIEIPVEATIVTVVVFREALTRRTEGALLWRIWFPRCGLLDSRRRIPWYFAKLAFNLSFFQRDLALFRDLHVEARLSAVRFSVNATISILQEREPRLR